MHQMYTCTTINNDGHFHNWRKVKGRCYDNIKGTKRATITCNTCNLLSDGASQHTKVPGNPKAIVE